MLPEIWSQIIRECVNPWVMLSVSKIFWNKQLIEFLVKSPLKEVDRRKLDRNLENLGDLPFTHIMMKMLGYLFLTKGMK